MSTKTEYEKPYEDLIGFVPPRIQNRIRLGLEVDPELLAQTEQIRKTAMYPKCFDVKTAQPVSYTHLTLPTNREV